MAPQKSTKEKFLLFRLQGKVDLLTFQTKGGVAEKDVYELADSLGFQVSKRQATAMIRKSNKGFGY